MGKFIVSAEGERYTFHFVSANGDRIATSLLHITRSATQHALNETRKWGQNAELYKKKNYDGKYFFELRSLAGNILLRSEEFASLENRDHAITIMIREAELAGCTEAIMI